MENNRTIFFLTARVRFFSFPYFSRSEIKSEGYGVDALDGGMRGGGFGYKKAANKTGSVGE